VQNQGLQSVLEDRAVRCAGAAHHTIPTVPLALEAPVSVVPDVFSLGEHPDGSDYLLHALSSSYAFVFCVENGGSVLVQSAEDCIIATTFVIRSNIISSAFIYMLKCACACA
jgi:hypothetical protein